jgi:hypothetical protein
MVPCALVSLGNSNTLIAGIRVDVTTSHCSSKLRA